MDGHRYGNERNSQTGWIFIYIMMLRFFFICCFCRWVGILCVVTTMTTCCMIILYKRDEILENISEFCLGTFCVYDITNCLPCIGIPKTIFSQTYHMTLKHRWMKKKKVVNFEYNHEISAGYSGRGSENGGCIWIREIAMHTKISRL